MAVHLTRIYTRTGDAGTTALGDMSRVAKSDARVGAYADCDETNAVIGMAIASGGIGGRTAEVLGVIQNDLFDVGADLCTPIVEAPEYEPLRVTEDQVTQLESWCDDFNEGLTKLSSFILPGGTVGRRPPAPCPHRGATCRTQRVAARRSGPGQRLRPALPQSAVGPAVHPGPIRKPRR